MFYIIMKDGVPVGVEVDYRMAQQRAKEVSTGMNKVEIIPVLKAKEKAPEPVKAGGKCTGCSDCAMGNVCYPRWASENPP